MARRDPTLLRSPGTRGRRRPPRSLVLARLSRWPRPFGAFLVVLVAIVGAFVWGSLLWVAAAVWGLTAASAVLDARLRGRFGAVAGLTVALFGPIAAMVCALSFRRAVRKVTPRYGSALPIALLAGAAGVVVCSQAGGFVVDHLGDTITVPNPAMAPDIRQGDRVVVSKRSPGDVGRGDVVVVRAFPRAEAALGRAGPYAGVFRVVGLQGEWVGATDRGLYRCTRRPDVSDGVTKADGCSFPDESAYVSTQTVPFGPVRVDDVSVWVMGDNRDVLGDSRDFGAVPIGDVEGVVVATLWPLKRVGVR
jgi:signal peptidase I